MSVLHVHEWGDPAAPTLVCLHGVTSHGARFRRLAEDVLSPRFHVLAPDLRGHGRSPWEPPWSLEQHLDDVLASVPADARLWIGHSFGGRLVLELAAREPARVERGVLLDPAIWVPGPEALPRAEASRADVSFATVDEAIDARYADGSVHAAPRALLEEDFREHLVRGDDGRYRLRFCRSAVVGAYGEMARLPPQGRLATPLLLVRALQSDVCPLQLVGAYRELAGDLLETVDVPGGHIVMWDALDETAAAIVRFL